MNIKKLTALLFFMMFTQVSLAAGIAKVAIDQEHTMDIFWLDNNTVRMSTSYDKSSYLLILKQRAYAVYREGKQYQVLDMSSMFESLGSMAKDANPMQHDSDLDIDWDAGKLKKTGKQQTIAGINGQVYAVEDGQSAVSELVLSNNPLVVEMTAAYFSLIQAMAPQNKDEIAPEKALPKDHQGLLAAGSGFTLKQISAETPKQNLFELPAKPQNMQEIMQGLQQQMMKQFQQ